VIVHSLYARDPGPQPRQTKLGVRCAHPHCRTSLDEYPVQCPHGLSFCEHCTWEEVCSECAA
jgi:hypothetical protein